MKCKCCKDAENGHTPGCPYFGRVAGVKITETFNLLSKVQGGATCKQLARLASEIGHERKDWSDIRRDIARLLTAGKIKRVGFKGPEIVYEVVR